MAIQGNTKHRHGTAPTRLSLLHDSYEQIIIQQCTTTTQYHTCIDTHCHIHGVAEDAQPLTHPRSTTHPITHTHQQVATADGTNIDVVPAVAGSVP